MKDYTKEFTLDYNKEIKEGIFLKESDILTNFIKKSYKDIPYSYFMNGKLTLEQVVELSKKEKNFTYIEFEVLAESMRMLKLCSVIEFVKDFESLILRWNEETANIRERLEKKHNIKEVKAED